MIEVAIVGAGYHAGTAHGPALDHCRRSDDDVEFVAVCDVDADTAREYAAEFDVDRVYTDHERMVEDASPDAVLIVTPIEATAPVTRDLLATDVALLVEKPPGTSSDETERLAALATKRESPHQVSFNRRFTPAIERALSWIRDRAPPTFVYGRQRRVDRLESEFVFDAGIHPVDTVRSILGAPERVAATRWRSRESGGESAIARLQFEDGGTGMVSLLPDAGTHAETYELSGPGYTVHADVFNARASLSVDGEVRKEWTLADSAPDYERDGTLAETRAFLAAVRGDRRFEPTLDESVETMRMIEAIEAADDVTLTPSDEV